MSYSITQNTIFLTVASIGQKIISSLYFFVIAHLVGVENTGRYFFAIAFTTIFTVVADLGLGPVLTREIARAEENRERYINTALLAKIVFGVIAYLLIIFSSYILGYDSSLRFLLAISGITMFSDNILTVFYSTFRASKNLKLESFGIVFSQFVTLCIGSVALYLKAPLVFLIIAYTVPSIMMAVIAGIMVKIRFKVRLFARFDWQVLKILLGFSWAFALAALLSRLYSYSDSIFISKALSPEHLGWWSLPYKITFAFQFIPIALATSIFPVLSSVASDTDKIRKTFVEAWHYLFLIVFPLSFGLIAIARPVIIKMSGASYLPSVPVLQILLVSLIFGFLTFISGALLNATNRQNLQTMLMALALIVNVGLNIFLIPRFGLLGAASAALIANLVLAVAGYLICNHYFHFPQLAITIKLVQCLIPAALMALAAYYLVNIFPLPIVIILAGILYFVLIMLSGGINKQYIKNYILKLAA